MGQAFKNGGATEGTTFRLCPDATGEPWRSAVLDDALVAVGPSSRRGGASSAGVLNREAGKTKLRNFSNLSNVKPAPEPAGATHPADAPQPADATAPCDGASESGQETPAVPADAQEHGDEQGFSPDVPDDAAAPEAASSRPHREGYGWVEGGLPTPPGGGSYAVRFVGDDEVKVLAYLDPFGRAFAVDAPLTVPPARHPDVLFRRDEDGERRRGDQGSVLVYDGDGGGPVDVARFSCRDDVYELFDTWYAFRDHAGGLGYNDALARAFFAFSYRPSLGAARIPARGLGSIFDQVRSNDFVRSLTALVDHVDEALKDPALQVPGLVQCFVRWLDEAAGGSFRSLGLADGDLRLVRTVRYANTFFVGNESETKRLSASQVWGIEAAINRFLLASERLGDEAATADLAQAQEADRLVIAEAATQKPVVGPLAGAPKHLGARDARGTEWQFRCRFAAAMERMRVPFRVQVSFRSDVREGIACLDVTVPNEAVMAGCPPEESMPDLSAAVSYGLHMGLFAVAAAFRSDERIERVHLYLHGLDDEQVGEGPMRSMGLMQTPDSFDELLINHVERGEGEGGEREGVQAEDGDKPLVFDLNREDGVVVAAFDRAFFEERGGFEEARRGDALELLRACGAVLSRFALQGVGPFDAMKALASYQARLDLPEVGQQELPPEAAEALGTDDAAGMRIVFDGWIRRFAEGLADAIVDAPTVAEAIRIVRAAQEQESQKRSEPTVSACTRLMTALAEGSVERTDPNAIVSVCLGEDRCRMAIARAEGLSDQGKYDEAASALIDAIRESAALDGFIDGPRTVFRSFESYASRLLYNLVRQGSATDVADIAADDGRRVKLTSDSFYNAHAEATRMLERSFEYTEQAEAYGKRLVELSPAGTLGYRVLGRAYMLVGDMESARETLAAGLKVALVPGDISALYYQIAYVLWKMGKPVEGAACYAKCLEISQVVAVQAQVELDELLEEAHLPAPAPEVVDRTLRLAGVPVAPRGCLLNKVERAIVAAVDEDLFAVARGLLAIRLRYRPDDALSNVLRSLSD